MLLTLRTRSAVTTIKHARLVCLFFFFNDTATTEIYTLSLHDALPISKRLEWQWKRDAREVLEEPDFYRSEEHTSELQSHDNLVCRLLLEKKTKRIRIDCDTDLDVAAGGRTRRHHPHQTGRPEGVGPDSFFYMDPAPPERPPFPRPPPLLS